MKLIAAQTRGCRYARAVAYDPLQYFVLTRLQALETALLVLGSLNKLAHERRHSGPPLRGPNPCEVLRLIAHRYCDVFHVSQHALIGHVLPYDLASRILVLADMQGHLCAARCGR